MLSLTTKALLEFRILAMLASSAPGTNWAMRALDEVLTTTLEEYSRAKPYTGVYTMTVPAFREFGVQPVELLSVIKIWYPYTAAKPEYPPAWVDFDFWWHLGSPYVLLKVAAVPDGTKFARIWYTTLHALSGLAGGLTSTFSAADDAALVVGACGYALLQRSEELDDATQPMPRRTPNYGKLAQVYLARFQAMLYASRGTVL